MNQLQSIKDVYSKKESFLITLFGALFLGGILFYFTSFEQIYWNIGALYAITQVVVQVLLSLLFGLNLALLWYKLRFVAESNNTGRETTSTVIGSVISVIVSGCPACGITLASYLGLATFFTAFPLYGLELKLLGLGLLMYSTNDIAKDMYVCKIKKA